MGSRRDFVQGRTTVRLAGAMLVLAGLLGVPARGACSSAGPVNFSGNLDLVYVTRPNKTDVRNDQVPTTAEDIVANRGLGYRTSFLTPGLTGVGYDGGSATPVMYENCWDFGLVALGTVAPFEFAAGVTNGTVGAPVMSDDNDGKQILGRIGFVPAPWLRAGISGARGPYLQSGLNEDLPPGHTVDEYMQVLLGSDLE